LPEPFPLGEAPICCDLTEVAKNMEEFCDFICLYTFSMYS
jgi:hypothetical protein